jgi:pilus assembly protein Flp/PilA
MVPATRKETVVKVRILHLLRSLYRDESGQDLIEYALVAALIAFAAVGALGILANGINSAFTVIGSKVGSAIGS